jgi:hypothetical protein
MVFLAMVVTGAVMAIVVATVTGCEDMRDLHLFPFIPS